MRDPKLTFLIRCAYGAVWLALIWLMVRYVLVWLLPFLIALALAALLEPAVVLCRRRLHLRRGFTATVLSLVVLGTVAAGLVLLAMVLLRQVCELSGRLPGIWRLCPGGRSWYGAGRSSCALPARRDCGAGWRLCWMGCRLSWRSCWRAWASGACGR